MTFEELEKLICKEHEGVIGRINTEELKRKIAAELEASEIPPELRELVGGIYYIAMLDVATQLAEKVGGVALRLSCSGLKEYPLSGLPGIIPY